jgi:mannose-6-phosphate isomerase-like protein (cupin superfamily)
MGYSVVNVVVEGSGVWRIEGEEVPVRQGTFLRSIPGRRVVPSPGRTG